MNCDREYAFLSCLIPVQMEKEVMDSSRNNMQDAANALQWHILEGLSSVTKMDIHIFNCLPIGSFPQYYNKPFVKKSCFDTDFNKSNVNIGFNNIKLIRKYIQPHCIYKELNKWCKKSSATKTLFVYTISSSFMTAVSKLKEDFPNLKICAIVADLPDKSSLSSKKSVLQKLFEKQFSKKSYSNLNCIDGYVLLTKQMADYLKITQPYCVMEGIATEFSNDTSELFHDDGLKKILYTGTLHKKFGILNLLEAFKKIENPDYRLIICGIGDSTEIINEISKTDSRIDYKGQLPRTEILKLQNQATVLVNPRMNDHDFTKYSFPSKNIEYMSSGKPVIAYKLDGIPDEYDNYLIYPTDNSIDSLKDVLVQVCEMSNEKRNILGQNASEFIHNHKNSVIQCQKIFDFVNSI